jgi:hypothetical protein
LIADTLELLNMTFNKKSMLKRNHWFNI